MDMGGAINFAVGARIDDMFGVTTSFVGVGGVPI
jgi:hypothetical protein